MASTPKKLAADEGDLWNSGKVASAQLVHVAYVGAPLRSRARCYWKVRTWTDQSETTWSPPAGAWACSTTSTEKAAGWPGPHLFLGR